MPKPGPGEVWLVDLGLAAKVRPCLLLSDYPAANELALMVVVPHTTSVRANNWEYRCQKPFLQPSVFHLQQIQPVSLPRLQRKLGELTAEEYNAIGTNLIQLLHLAGRPNSFS